MTFLSLNSRCCRMLHEQRLGPVPQEPPCRCDRPAGFVPIRLLISRAPSRLCELGSDLSGASSRGTGWNNYHSPSGSGTRSSMERGGEVGEGARRIAVGADGSALRMRRVTPIGVEGQVARGFPPDP